MGNTINEAKAEAQSYDHMLSGSVPPDICLGDGSSPLSDLFLSYNQLTGSLDVSDCLNLVLLDCGFNNMTGALSTPRRYNHLHTVLLSNNSLDITSTLTGLIDGQHIITMEITNNR